MRYLFLLLFFFSSFQLSAQDSLSLNFKTIGIEYFGELALHPGVRADIGIPLWINTKLKGKKNKVFFQNIIIRPNIGYYHLPKYTNNFMIGLDFSLQFVTQKISSKNHFSFESYFGLRYMRYSYIGTIYESNGSGGFEEKNIGGGNAFVMDSGFLIGGSLPFKNYEWILGAEYFLEFSEDKLVIHHPVARLGIRIGL